MSSSVFRESQSQNLRKVNSLEQSRSQDKSLSLPGSSAGTKSPRRVSNLHLLLTHGKWGNPSTAEGGKLLLIRGRFAIVSLCNAQQNDVCV